jgi:N-acetylglucosaminyl-diphospho-decaprenol L-rhamnosyltransferase
LNDDNVRSGTARADVVVVAYETPEALDLCLQALTDAATVEQDRIGRIVVVDNSPSDRCREVAARHEGVEVIHPDSNVGFGRAVNIGLMATRGDADYVLILNADTEIRRGAIGALIDHLVAHPVAAMAGPSLTDAQGRVEPSCGEFPTPARLLLGQTGLWRPLVRLSGRRDLQPLHNPASSGPVPWVLGAALMVDRRAIEQVGGFDPGFHMYFEEVDLSQRLSSIRRQTHFVAHATVRHIGGASTSREPGVMERLMYTSLARHLRLHGRSPRLVGLRVAVAVIALAHLARGVPTGRDRNTWREILSDAARGWPV